MADSGSKVLRSLVLGLLAILITQNTFAVTDELPSSHTVKTLEDVELLSYFLLWKYNYFDHHLDEGDKSGSVSNDDTFIVDETVLRNFLENVRQKVVFEPDEANSSIGESSLMPHRFNCRDLDMLYENIIPKSVPKEKATAFCEVAAKCQSPHELLKLIGSHYLSHDQKEASNGVPVKLSEAVVRICPILLFQLHDEHCIDERENHINEVKAKSRPSTGAVWGFGLLFVTIISFCSLVGVAILPFLTQSSYDMILTLFEGLAVGSLVGSAIFHLIPQAFNLLGEDSEHGYLWKALIIFGGIYLFYCSERLMKIVVEYRRKKKLRDMPLPSVTSEYNEMPKEPREGQKRVCFTETKNQHDTSAFNSTGDGQISTSPDKTSPSLTEENHLLGKPVSNSNSSSLLKLDSLTRNRSRSSSFTKFKHGHSHGGDHSHEGDIATVAWMIIFGDGLHNFIDGLSIGAAFSESILAGISISVACICEEFPHELGDFAVLLSSGMTMKQAMGYNFLSACTCYIGMGFGIFLGDLEDGSSYIFALAGGMFLYIALVDMMGELSDALEASTQESMTKTFKVLLLQNIGILVGVFALFLLAKYSEHINFEGLAPPDQSETLIANHVNP